jgi:arginyl-tRNA synthetase
MLLDIHTRIKDALRAAISSKWNIEPPDIVLNQTPKIELGELATPVCFELAKRLRMSPRAAAEELVQACGSIPAFASWRLPVRATSIFPRSRTRAARRWKRGGDRTLEASRPSSKVINHTEHQPE